MGNRQLYDSWINQDENRLFQDAIDEAKLRSDKLKAAPAFRNASLRKMAAIDYELGFIAELQRDWATAEEKYAKAIEGFGPDSSHAYVTYIALGRVQRRAEKLDVAEDTLTTAHELDSSAPWALLELALVHKDDQTIAREYLNSARAIAPLQAYVDIVEAQLCNQWQAFDCAEEAYEQALEKRPNSGWLYGQVAGFYYYDPQFTQEPYPHQDLGIAVGYYEKAVERRINDPWAHERLAAAHFYQGNYESAAEHYSLSLEQFSHPQSQLAARYCTLGQAQQQAAMLELALETYQTCLEKMDDDDELRPTVEALIAEVDEQLSNRSD